MNRGAKAKLRKVKGAIIIKDGTQYTFAAKLGLRESLSWRLSRAITTWPRMKSGAGRRTWAYQFGKFLERSANG